MSTNRILALVSTLSTQRGIHLSEHRDNLEQMFPSVRTSEKLDGLIDAYSLVINELLNLRFMNLTDDKVITRALDFTYRAQGAVKANDVRGGDLDSGYGAVQEHLFEAYKNLPASV